MITSLRRPLLGVSVAIAVTTGLDATGLTAFSALPLLPLLLLFWLSEPRPRPTLGFTLGRPAWYGLAVLHSLAVLGTVTLICVLTGSISLGQTNWNYALPLAARIAAGTVVAVILTEEGFFRGWLWGSLGRTGLTPDKVIIATSVAFALWHLSWVTLTSDGRLPFGQVVVFMVNAAILGTIWGLVRAISGSVIVASVSHGIWNGIDYAFFGAGPKVGAFGIANTALYGPEVGVLGLVLNLAFSAVLWRWWRARGTENA